MRPRVSVVIACIALTACGGGRSTPLPPANQPPTITLLSPTSIPEGGNGGMNIDVGDPEDGVASVIWVQTAGPAISWRGAGTYGIAFQAPYYEQAQSLSFRVTATDGKG